MRIKAIGARKEIRLRKNYGEPWAPARPAKKSKIEVRLSSFACRAVALGRRRVIRISSFTIETCIYTHDRGSGIVAERVAARGAITR